MRDIMALAAIAGWLQGGLAFAAEPGLPAVPAAPAASAASPPADTAMRPVALTRLVIRMTAGQPWLAMQGGLLCLPSRKLIWDGGQKDLKGNEYVVAFRDTMTSAGFKVEGDPDNLFETSAPTSDYQVAGVITNMNIHFCLPKAGFGDSSSVRGVAAMDMEWQVYSTLRKTVMATVKTHGGFGTTGTGTGGFDGLILAAFRDNLKTLAADETFRKVLTGPPVGAGDLARPTTTQATISLPGASAPDKRPIADAVASVDTIFAGSTQGSGFLASSDGLLLTDQHVVGQAQYVKVRWPDGIEFLGEVVRSDKVRDVALVKTDPRGRKALRLRRDAPQVGDTVYAVGAPLDVKFASTVTRGVVSANRTFEGLNFLQSDVGVNPGSSGGPLLDENGAAVGLTEAGMRVGGAPEGINLFTPMRDALEFLGAEPK
jgi:S1-C subfamily serine protease